MEKSVGTGQYLLATGTSFVEISRVENATHRGPGGTWSPGLRGVEPIGGGAGFVSFSYCFSSYLLLPFQEIANRNVRIIRQHLIED